MKTTVNVNLNGRVFTMDQDAFQLLDSYLKNLRVFFKREKDAAEILIDFEARIEELLSEKIRLGYQVITIKEVEEVIARVGTLEELSEEGADAGGETKNESPRPEENVKKRLHRNLDDRMFGGVCSGIAAFLGWDVLLVRIIFIILFFATSFFLFPVYLLGWIFIPPAVTAEQKLQMRGEPITVENIGKTVAQDATKQENPQSGKNNFGNVLLQVFVVIAKVLLIAIGCLLLFPLLIILFVFIMLALAFLGVSTALFTLPFSIPFLDEPVFQLSGGTSLVLILLILLTFGIPIGILFYHILAHFIKSKPVSATVKWIIAIIWIVSLIAFIIFGGYKMFSSPVAITKSVITYASDGEVVRGNGILQEKEWVVANPVEELILPYSLWATVQIEPSDSDSVRILLNGDENLVNRVGYQATNETLRLTTLDDVRFGENNLIVRIQAPLLHTIRFRSLGNLNIFNKFAGENLKVFMSGAGRFQADSLYVDRFTFKADGISSANIKGKVRYALLEAEAVGAVNAFELQADTVQASMEGVGSILCHPLKHLDAKVDGIGNIIYRNEPETKKTAVDGIGSIKRE